MNLSFSVFAILIALTAITLAIFHIGGSSFMFWNPYLEEIDVKKTADLNSSLLALLAKDKEELALSIIENDSCLKTAVRLSNSLEKTKRKEILGEVSTKYSWVVLLKFAEVGQLH